MKKTQENNFEKDKELTDNQKMSQFCKRNFYTIKDSGLVYLLALVLPLVVSLVFSLISVSVAGQVGLKFPEGSNILEELFSRYLWFAVIYLLITQVTFLVIWFSYHKSKKISFKATGFSVKKTNIWTALLCMLTGIVCVLGFVWLMEGCFGKLFTIWGINSGMEFKINTVGRLFVALLVLGVVPAIVEELIFRGVIFGGLRKSFGMWTSVLLCGLLFALMHQSIVQLLYPFILGCVLSIVMEKTGNILYTILIHMFNNFTTILLTFVFEYFEITDVTTVFNVKWWGVLCAIALAGVTCVILWVLYRFYLCKQKKLENPQVEDSQGSKKGQERSISTFEDSSHMIGKIPLTMLCGIILAAIFLVISLIP